MAKDSFSLVDFHRYLTKFKNQLFEAKSQKLNFQVVTRHLEVINKKGPVLQRPCTKKKKWYWPGSSYMLRSRSLSFYPRDSTWCM